MNCKDQDVFSGGLLILFALPGYFCAAQIENLKVSKLSGAFFPDVCFTVMLVCGLILIRQGLQREEKIPLPSINWPKLLPVVGVLIAYVLIMEYVGFIISTMAFMLCCMYAFGVRRKKILLSVPIITAFGVYYLFGKAFMIVLPGLSDLGMFQ
ncbi:tripartite tricarboxylate transporter TctB family protein [Oleispirillum naphthae]|uniref:tripartite tricarboxylate transporter TctB family protein n=1 Tax=Oleispirillum naphthae TaxID=2838853 RepID=UPI0030822054